MKLPRFIFPSLVIIFFIAVPLLLLFTAGYRFDFKTGTWSQLGLIIIDGKPKQTTVYINDEYVGQKLPVKQKSVPPDFYRMKLTSSGYHDLYISRELRSGETLVISPVFLLKDSTPVLLDSSNLMSVVSNRDRTQFFMTIRDDVGDTLRSYRPDDNTWQTLYLSGVHENWRLIPNRDASIILMQSNASSRIVWSDGSRSRVIEGDDLTWSKTDSSTLFGVNQLGLFSEDVVSGRRTILSPSVDRLLTISSHHAWFIQRVSNISQLVSFSFDSKNTHYIDSDPVQYNAQLRDAPTPLIQRNGSLYSVSPDELSFMMPFDDHSIVWEQESDRLEGVVFNAFDVGVIEPSSRRYTSISRFAGDIRTAAPLFGTEYVLVATQTDLFALHTASSNHAFIPLLSDVHIDTIISHELGTSVYLSGVISGKKGLFELSLRDR